jgi:hypothetical protein
MKASIKKNERCYDANLATYGGFALLFRRDTIPAILRWLDEYGAPADNFFGYMNKHKRDGFLVQVRSTWPAAARRRKLQSHFKKSANVGPLIF